MKQPMRVFILTPLLFMIMIVVPAVALSADGYLSMGMLQSPVLVPTPVGDGGVESAQEVPQSSTETDANVIDNASSETVTDEPISAEEQAAPVSQNDEQPASAQAAGVVTATSTMTDTNSGGTDVLPATETPSPVPTGGSGVIPSTATSTPVGGGAISPLPTPTSVNTSPLPTPSLTATSTSVPPTVTTVPPTATVTSAPPTVITVPTTRPVSTVPPTSAPTTPPVVTVQPTAVLPPTVPTPIAPTPIGPTPIVPTRTAPTASSAYPTPMRAVPTPTPEIPASALRLNGFWVKKIVSDRFSSVLYAYANEWLYRSEDSGATWVLVTSLPVVDDFVMSADDPNILFSGNGNSCEEGATTKPMLKSENGGLSWFELPKSDGLRPLLAHPFNAELLVADDCKRLYISEDGGVNWNTQSNISADVAWQNYTIVSMSAVYMEDTENPADLAWQRLYVGAQAADGSGIVAYTEDLGMSWHQITPAVSPAPWGMSTITLDPFSANGIWFADKNGVWYTPDGGTDWRFTYLGLDIDEEGGAGALIAMIIHPTGQIYLGTEHGLYTKVFDGTSWIKVANTAFDMTQINSIQFTETNPNLLYLNTSDGVHLVKIEG